VSRCGKRFREGEEGKLVVYTLVLKDDGKTMSKGLQNHCIKRRERHKSTKNASRPGGKKRDEKGERRKTRPLEREAMLGARSTRHAMSG